LDQPSDLVASTLQLGCDTLPKGGLSAIFNKQEFH
jgi:hypothetical protein